MIALQSKTTKKLTLSLIETLGESGVIMIRQYSYFELVTIFIHPKVCFKKRISHHYIHTINAL